MGFEGEGLCSPMPPPGSSTGGALLVSSETFSSVAMLPVAERVEHPIVAAPLASPVPVAIGGRCPTPPVNYRTGQLLI